MLSRTKDSYVTIDEMKQVPEWEACVKAIEQAQKDAYNQAIDDVIKSVKVVNTKKLNFETGKWENVPLIDQTSILKLKK